MDLSIEELEEWQTVSCNSCARHNYKDSTVNQAMYVDIKMYELSARSQTTVLCHSCLLSLKDMLNERY